MHPNSPERFTPDEIDFLKQGALFEKKEALTKRIQNVLKDLGAALKTRLEPGQFLAPDGTDFVQGQVVRGERFHSRPFVYLDFPKFFSRRAMFSFRSFFWWGHDFVFAWILAGPELSRYQEQLIRHLDHFRERGYSLSVAEDPWEWRRSAPTTVEINRQSPGEIEGILKPVKFLKVQYYVGLDDPVWRKGGLIQKGLQVFEDLRVIVHRIPE